jgi:asparagine synthase (glutamine-hydrolysing)
MCGIVGVVQLKPCEDRSVLVAMRDSLRHRGPDDAGVWWSPDARVGLGNRRLAIMDLSHAGHQPMVDSAGKVCITFNGELYNHRELRRELELLGHGFQTTSDTEVVLAAYLVWGGACLTRLNGMFAFAIYDGRARCLFLARDRAGEKPLFYVHGSRGLAFASELKGLMADPAFARRLSAPALDHYLAYGYVPGDQCIFDGTRKLPPAHAAMYDLDAHQLRVWRYWDLPEPPDGRAAFAIAELEERLDALLEDAVRKQLIADVPVGILLSGGVDSSLVTAMAARVSAAPVMTFTITFPGYPTHDEGPFAKLVASHFGTRHLELPAEPAIVDVLPTLARQYDEPLADHSMVPTYLVSKLVREHATVALGGDGGDELFGGYPHYSRVARVRRLSRWLPSAARSLVSQAATRALPLGFRGRNQLIGWAGAPSRSIAHINLYFDAWTRERLLHPAVNAELESRVAPEHYQEAMCNPRHSFLRQCTEADFRTTLVDGYLVKVDRASSLASLEMRAPWLDHRIIEFAFGAVPDALRATETERKILPRHLARRVLPSTLNLERKQGLSMPLHRWFDGSWGPYMEEVLSDAEPALFERGMIRNLLAWQRRGLDNTGRLFALTMFELWRREYRVVLPA